VGKLVFFIYQVAYFLHKAKIPFAGEIINKLFVRILFGCQIGLGAKIGKKCSLGYEGLGIVIHKRAEIGENVNIGTCVTIGGSNLNYGVPKIGNNCIIASGAKILGDITIGVNCVVAANAVLISSIPDNCLAAGVPAKVVKKDINILNYRNL
jgi:serine O-acetyltransferase